MVLQRLLGAVPVVISELVPHLDVGFGYQNQSWNVVDAHGARHEIPIPRMVHQPTQLPRFRCRINAAKRQLERVNHASRTDRTNTAALYI